MSGGDPQSTTSPGAPIWGYRRPDRQHPMSSFAEALLARRHGWDLDVVQGKRAVGRFGSSGAYLVLAPEVVFREATGNLRLLRLRLWGRFGNAYNQLIHVLYAARRYRIRSIELEPHPQFNGARAGEIRLSWGPIRSAATEPGLEGSFAYLAGLGLAPAPEERAAIVSRYVRQLLDAPLRQPDPDVGEDDLVMHFRAGDVFDQRGPHPAYGQPPASYYLAAAERETPKRVWLVFEDRGNPAIDAVEAALRSRGIEVRTQSADLVSDMRVLLTATTLVASRGSFCPALAGLSTRMRKFYLFEDRDPAVEKFGITVVEVSDRLGDYRARLISGNWRASPEQLALMLSYPAAALSFPEPR
jgi:hypothetical protein